MHKMLRKAASLSFSVGIVATFGSGVAQAADRGESTDAAVSLYTDCETRGVYGWGTFDVQSTSYVTMQLNVEDTVADGHHVAVRFVSGNGAGEPRFWQWHHLYDGKGSQGKYNLAASDPGGNMNFVGLEVGVLEGSEVIGDCWDFA